MTENRLVSLEEKLAFVERDVEHLDGAVRELADRLDAVAGELSRLRMETRGRLDDLESGSEDDASSV